ncbi:MAG TPA: DUF1801 domain-containing protein [Bryobacteraceae bacterium]|nr:DUF1801 domain-containing protein [Bryobacteraceae bacterium]
MASPAYKTIDDYIALQPASSRAALERVRSAIRKALPQAEEVISYQIPAFKLNGRVVIFFAGWKEHYSIYPAGPAMCEAFKNELASYELSHKGTIRFPLNGRVPVKLIAHLAKFRANEVAEHFKAKAAARKAKVAG